MTVVNIEVVKTGNESTGSLLRRFTKRVQGAGIVKRVRSIRYAERDQSPYSRKKRALKRIARRKETERMKKLGKEKVR